MDRRTFFRISSISGGGLLISSLFPLGCQTPKPIGPDWEPNFFLRISPDNTITFSCAQSEIGQGTSTGLAMILADELGASLEKIEIEFAEGSEERFGYLQDTGGSNGVRMTYQPLREASATAREILITAAAQTWNVSGEACYAKEGAIHLKNTDKQIPFGDLIHLAVTLPAPRTIQLKEKSEFEYIGKPAIGPKTYQAAEGKVPYGIDVQLPDMVYAAIQRCPVWGGKLVSFKSDKAKAFPGVIDVVELEPTELQSNDYKGGVRPGVVVLATNTWAALEAKKLLEIEWDFGPNGNKSDSDMREELEAAKNQTNEITHDFKNGAALFRNGMRYIEASYESPFQVNACMEPLNAVAYHMGYKVEVWSGTQSPKMTRERIAELTKLPLGAVTIHNQPAGGGFGRRFFIDFVEEAVILSELIRKPVKVTWSRADTFSTSKYHPFRTEYWSAALDRNNYPVALSNKGVVEKPNGYRPYPYSLPAAFHKYLTYKDGNLLPRASWRSVMAHPWGLGLECFIDELAHEAGIDPVQFRMDLLDKAEIVEQVLVPWVGDDLYPQKLKRTLEVAAERSDWSSNGQNGIFKGVSAIGYNTSYCTQIADVPMVNEELKVHKITAVFDCGLVINPKQVEAQIEGSIMWALSALLKAPITVQNGVVQEKNYDTYDLLRMHEAPEVDIILLESEDAPSGTGEPAVPGTAPAVLNALFAATGKRIRQLPITKSLLAQGELT